MRERVNIGSGKIAKMCIPVCVRGATGRGSHVSHHLRPRSEIAASEAVRSNLYLDMWITPGRGKAVISVKVYRVVPILVSATSGRSWPLVRCRPAWRATQLARQAGQYRTILGETSPISYVDDVSSCTPRLHYLFASKCTISRLHRPNAPSLFFLNILIRFPTN